MYKAVLDACVIFPACLRDTLLSVAGDGCFTPYWSSMIHDEWQRNLLEKKPELKEEVLRTAKIMDQCFVGSCVAGFEHQIEQLTLPDPDDCHVLALAIATQSEYIVTNNLKDFPAEELDKHMIIAISPDDFLVKLYDELDILVIEAIKTQRARLKHPSKTQDQFIETLKESGLVSFGEIIDKKKDQF